MNTKPLGRWDLPSRTEWEEMGFTVPDELCSPEPLHIEAPHLTRKDPGQSEPDTCTHDWFWRPGGIYVCHWCGLKIKEEP